MITVKCSCGETYYADESHVGRSIRCSKCDQAVPILALLPRATDLLPLRKSWHGRWQVGVVAVSITICLIVVFSMYSVRKDGGPPVTDERRTDPGTTPVAKSIATCESSQSPPPANGLIFRKLRNQTGRGLLTIDNGTSTDADVKLVSGTRALQWTYISTGQKLQFRGIPPGNYRLRFCQGTSWNSKERKFICSRVCSELDKTFEFTEEHKGDFIEYGAHTVTLHEVLAGNITKSRLDPAVFDSLDVSDEERPPRRELNN